MDNTWGKMKFHSILSISAYYIILIISSLVFIIYTFCKYSVLVGINAFIFSLTISIPFALVSSSIYYTRKIYKLCIEGRIVKREENDNYQEFGLILYLITRPLFAVFFSIFTVIFLYSFLCSLVSSSNGVGDGFIFSSIVISTAISYASGTFLDTIDKKFKCIAETIL